MQNRSDSPGRSPAYYLLQDQQSTLSSLRQLCLRLPKRLKQNCDVHFGFKRHVVTSLTHALLQNEVFPFQHAINLMRLQLSVVFPTRYPARLQDSPVNQSQDNMKSGRGFTSSPTLRSGIRDPLHSLCNEFKRRNSSDAASQFC